MRKWPDECIDLIYLDPPFKSDTNYNILYGTQNGKPAQLQAFEDTWYWDEKAIERVERIKGAVAHAAHKSIKGLHSVLGDCGMLAYLSYMAERLAEMQRLLKSTGSIYLHCDFHASHYLKVLMDEIFGAKNFRNEIIWRIGWVSGFKTQKKGWIRNHDTILYYLKTQKAKDKFNKEYLPYAEGYVRRDGKPPTGKGIPIEDTWNCSENDVLNSIMIMSFSREKMGYDTQKTRALLERIIKASSNEGDVVLDPFCGCGTTIDAAKRLKRNWIGIDISSFAIDLIKNERLKDPSIRTEGIPLDLAGAKRLADQDRFAFEKWAINRIPGFAPNQKQVGDKGIDGRATLMNKWNDLDIALAQVKSGGLGGLASDARDFLHVMDREQAVCGVFITTEKVDGRRGAHKDFANMGRFEIGAHNFPRAQFWSIEEHFEGRQPNLPPMLNPYTGEPMYQPPLI